MTDIVVQKHQAIKHPHIAVALLTGSVQPPQGVEFQLYFSELCKLSSTQCAIIL
jgi:hypothetical protein